MEEKRNPENVIQIMCKKNKKFKLKIKYWMVAEGIGWQAIIIVLF